MVINKKKTNVMNFPKSKKWSFPAELKFKDGTALETMRETKLLGVLVSDDLSWQKNTNYICEKARKKIWILRRMAEPNLEFKRSHLRLFWARTIFIMKMPAITFQQQLWKKGGKNFVLSLHKRT